MSLLFPETGGKKHKPTQKIISKLFAKSLGSYENMEVDYLRFQSWERWWICPWSRKGKSFSREWGSRRLAGSEAMVSDVLLYILQSGRCRSQMRMTARCPWGQWLQVQFLASARSKCSLTVMTSVHCRTKGHSSNILQTLWFFYNPWLPTQAWIFNQGGRRSEHIIWFF